MNPAAKLYKGILDFVYPRTCIISGKAIPRYNSNDFILDEHIENLPRPTLEHTKEFRSKLNSDESFALYTFTDDNELSIITHHLKYKGMKSIGNIFGEKIGNLMINRMANKYDLIVPVPMHKRKFLSRGYNQAEHIAIGISSVLNTPVYPDLVIKNRVTDSQTKLNKKQRLENMKNAFSLSKVFKNQVKGKSIIIADDVMTTGATINEVIRVLKDAGVNKICACSTAIAKHF